MVSFIKLTLKIAYLSKSVYEKEKKLCEELFYELNLRKSRRQLNHKDV